MSFITIKTNKMNHTFSCNEKCLIYLLTWQKWEKQYLAKKVDQFRLRCNNYKDNLLENFLQMKDTYKKIYISISFIDRLTLT